LDELQDEDVVFQDWVFETFVSELKEDLEAQLGRQIVAVDLTVHGISALGVEVVQLLFNL